MFEAKPLNYNYDALEPYISSRTIDIHYNKHYKKYLDNLNKLLSKYNFNYSKEELVKNIDIFPLKERGSILFNLGGVLNHELYFTNLEKYKQINGKFKEDIIKQYGSLDNFKNEFIDNTKLLVGSGYTFVVLNKENKIEIINTPNQDTPISYGLKPIMNLDLWEHAYYLDYQNRKDEYVNNFFSVVDFDKVNKNYEKALQENI